MYGRGSGCKGSLTRVLDNENRTPHLGGALRDFQFHYDLFLIFVIIAVYGIWEDLGAWKILLRDVPMICPQFVEYTKMSQNREASIFVPAPEFCPKQYNKIYLPAKAPPSCSSGKQSLLWLMRA